MVTVLRGQLIPNLRRLGLSFAPKRLISTSHQYIPPDISKLNIETWSSMDKDLKEEVIEYINWRMEENWKNLTPKEAQAAYFLSFGEWGPRAKNGNKDSMQQLSVPEGLVKGMFTSILFTAFGVAMVNYKKDKDIAKQIDELKSKCSV